MDQAQDHVVKIGDGQTQATTSPPQESQISDQDSLPPPAKQGNHSSQQPQAAHLGWQANRSDTLLVIAALITTLTYQVGTNPPGGFWQDDAPGQHDAGVPIMHDKHRRRYYLFMAASWVGFGDSMLLTLWLLTGAPTTSRRVRWSFAISYSCLQLTYITSMHGTSLSMDIATWAGVLAIVYLATLIGNDANEVDWFRRLCNKARQLFEQMTPAGRRVHHPHGVDHPHGVELNGKGT